MIIYIVFAKHIKLHSKAFFYAHKLMNVFCNNAKLLSMVCLFFLIIYDIRRFTLFRLNCVNVLRKMYHNAPINNYSNYKSIINNYGLPLQICGKKLSNRRVFLVSRRAYHWVICWRFYHLFSQVTAQNKCYLVRLVWGMQIATQRSWHCCVRAWFIGNKNDAL